MSEGSSSQKSQVPLDSQAETPSEIWNDYFQKRDPEPEMLRKLVLRLHNAGQHEHVIAALEAALVNGHSQPWMYEVLALSMKIADRPRKDIERVLLSRVDFTAADVPSMIYSAAYITRFGGEAQALKLYRQASRLEPTRPEPYILGLKLAKKLKDYESLQWAATGVLTYAWTEDHERLHQQAEDAAQEAQNQLHKQGKVQQAEAMKKAIQQARKRDLVVRLTWSGEGDLDLMVEEPLGTVCSLSNPHSRGGGVLAHDGYGPKQKNCYEKYLCPLAASGEYRIRIRHMWGQIVGKRAQLTVIKHMGTSRESKKSRNILLNKRDVVVRVTLDEGRREDLRPRLQDKQISIEELQSSQRVPRRGSGRRASRPSAQAAREFMQARRGLGGQPIGAAGPISGVGGGVGFQPIIRAVSEGAVLGTQAVVSGDRRYVRISTNVSFSALTDVFTFSFINSGNPNGNAGGGNQ